MDVASVQRFAVPLVCCLISGLAYGSQYLFSSRCLKPGPLTSQQWLTFNTLLLCLWISYARAVLTGPGKVPRDWNGDAVSVEDRTLVPRHRFCRKCNAAKPPRAHHCKICSRCIPKMDHHCPWTANCVSHFTFPHFMRFLLYAVVSMTYLEGLVYERAALIWRSRDLRHDLGPSTKQLVMFFILTAVNSLTLFMVGITFFRSFYALCCNVSTIESWEIERHEQLLRRARTLGGYLDGPDGMRIRITRQEFPYDIGIWRNICAAMGTSNPFGWLSPFARSPATDGLTYETNGFEDPGTSWPPPDPDRIARYERADDAMDAFTLQHVGLTDREELEAFHRRQQEDFQRRYAKSPVPRRKVFHKRYLSQDSAATEENDSTSGEEGWQDSSGNRLDDYGVDEGVEFYDEDEVPLAELLRQRQARLSGQPRAKMV